MKTISKSTLLIIVFIWFGCKNKSEPMLSDHKFSDKGIVINCDAIDLKLINEALFTFEEDINSYYSKSNPNLVLAYSRFIRDAQNGRIKYEEILTPHTVEVFNILKAQKDLWDINNAVSRLNYKSSFFNCIANNIQDKNLNITLKALLETNSMSPKLFGAPLNNRYSLALNDKYLAAYIAFDLFYAKLFDVNLTLVTERAPEKVDFNKIPK